MKTSYDPENKNTFYYLDDYGMVLRKPSWEGQDNGERDSISRTSEAYFAWREIRLIEANRTCVLEFFDKRGRYLKAYRHPNLWSSDMSRDHILGLLLGEKFTGNDDMLKDYAKHFRYRISDKFRFTPDLWAWMKMLAGKWWWSPVFYIISYFMFMFVYIPWNKLVYLIAPFSPEKHQYSWNPMSVKDITPRQFIMRRWLYKTYALNQFAWQLYVLKPNVFAWGLKKLALLITGKTNYLIRLLLGSKTVRLVDVENYKQMTGDRFGTTLNEATSRHVKIIRNPELIEANKLEEDLLKKLWELRKTK